MPTLALNQIPEDLLARLRQLAAEHAADIESEAMKCLEYGLTEREQTERELQELRELRAQYKGPPITEESINLAKREGLA